MTEIKLDLYCCSFCDKPQRKGKTIVTKDTNAPKGQRSSTVAICDECIELCTEILAEQNFKFAKLSVLPKDVIELLGIKPIFSGRTFHSREKHCFFLSPFEDPFDTIYKEHVAPTLDKVGISVERGDEIFSVDVIIEDIWKAINSAAIIVADVTGKNPNVMYEIGMAHTVGKPVLMISQSIEDVPFDLRHRRCIVYEYTPPGIRKLEEKLESTLEYVLGL
ncbi:hypothetical protein AB0L88_03430 [Saccharopolyspora shandongensis]|uniref:hypothetical protein n=1 Tax=Saccharopolyspora shandongensis TaxID=418495 RepID=UPI00344596F2